MTFQPMTFAEAVRLSELYSSLKGRSLCDYCQDQFIIDHVAVSPFDELDKRKFAHLLLETKDTRKAMESYKYSDFDVLLMSHDLSGNEIIYKDLRSYLSDPDHLPVDDEAMIVSA